MSLDDLTGKSHCPAMKEIIGKTRFGNDVWIEAVGSKDGTVSLSIASFDVQAEQYDVFCLMDAYRARLDRVKDQLNWGVRPNAVAEQIDEWLIENRGQLQGSEARALGHRVSTDRVRYAKGRLHPAYRGWGNLY